jgi:Poly(R)-hydroxyalkanoic acid synthase subunit (PHA_synth_III_E)
MESLLSHDRSSRAASPEGEDRSSNPFDVMRQLSSASADVWSAWTDTWTGVLANRGAPVSEVMLKTMANPTAWPTALVPILDEIRTAMKLPTFADFPGGDLFRLPSLAPLIGLLQVSQNYAAISLPIWIKACERFVAEVKDRKHANGEGTPSAGEVMDVWNNVLDRTLMEFNRSGEFAAAQQQLLHAAAQHRRELSGAFEKAARAVNMPTRTEMTDTYRRLHDLTREVHALRQEIREMRRSSKAATSAKQQGKRP